MPQVPNSLSASFLNSSESCMVTVDPSLVLVWLSGKNTKVGTFGGSWSGPAADFLGNDHGPCPFPTSRSTGMAGLAHRNDWSLFQWPWTSYTTTLSCSLNIRVGPKNSTSLLVYTKGKKAFMYDKAWQSHVLDNWVLIPWLGNWFGSHTFKLVN